MRRHACFEMAECKTDVKGDLGKSTRNVRMTELASGIGFEEEAFCERKVLQGRLGWGEQTQKEGGARQND